MPGQSDFSVNIPVRCHHAGGSPELPACGALATVVRPSSNGIPHGYFCAQHALPGDAPIASSRVEIRVSVSAEITLTGTSFIGPAARAEAVERLRLAVEQLGGVFSLHDVRAVVGRYEPWPPAGRQVRAGSRGH